MNPAEPQYQMTIAVQKDGDHRTLEVRSLIITTPLLVGNPLLVTLIRAHMEALAKHDAGQLTETTPEAAQTGKPN